MTQLSDYFFMGIGGGIGVFLHIMIKIKGLRAKFPEFTPNKIAATFFFQEWDSVIVSLVVISACMIMAHLGGVKYFGIAEDWTALVTFLFMIVIGYSGQRIAYKYLKTAEKVLSDKAKYGEED